MENVVEKSADRPLTDAEVMLEVEKVKELPGIAARQEAVKEWDDPLLAEVTLLLEKRHPKPDDAMLAFMGILKVEYYRRAEAHGRPIAASFAKKEAAALKAYQNRGGNLPKFPCSIEDAVRLITRNKGGDWKELEDLLLETTGIPQRTPDAIGIPRATVEATRAPAIAAYKAAGGSKAPVKSKEHFAAIVDQVWALWKQREPSLVRKSKARKAKQKAAGAKGNAAKARNRMMAALDATNPTSKQSSFLATLSQLDAGKLAWEDALEIVRNDYKHATPEALEECLAAYRKKVHL